jgi:hypothetical protein
MWYRHIQTQGQLVRQIMQAGQRNMQSKLTVLSFHVLETTLIKMFLFSDCCAFLEKKAQQSSARTSLWRCCAPISSSDKLPGVLDAYHT